MVMASITVNNDAYTYPQPQHHPMTMGITAIAIDDGYHCPGLTPSAVLSLPHSFCVSMPTCPTSKFFSFLLHIQVTTIPPVLR